MEEYDYEDYEYQKDWKEKSFDFLYKYRFLVLALLILFSYSAYSYSSKAEMQHQAKMAGFSSVDEMEMALEAGYFTKTDYSKYLSVQADADSKTALRESYKRGCEVYIEARNQCAAASDYDQCMSIKSPPSCAGEELVDSSRRLNRAYDNFYTGR